MSDDKDMKHIVETMFDITGLDKNQMNILLSNPTCPPPDPSSNVPQSSKIIINLVNDLVDTGGDHQFKTDNPFNGMQKCGYFMPNKGQPSTSSKPKTLLATQDVKPFRLLSGNSINNLVGTNLSAHYKMNRKNNLIKNYQKARDMKIMHFYRWIVDHRYFQTAQTKPDFICSDGRLRDILLTPISREAWTFNAIRIHDMIFLWDAKPTKRGGDIGSYSALRFQQMATGHSNPEVVKEHEKVHSVGLIPFQYGSRPSHQLLMYTDANEGSMGDNVIVRMKSLNSREKSDKFRKYWGDIVVLSASKFVLGLADVNSGDHILAKTEFLNEAQLWTRSRVGEPMKSSRHLCYDFVDQVLVWMKLQLPKNDQTVVKKFSYSKSKSGIQDGKFTIECNTERIGEKKLNTLLPRWFLDGALGIK
ncbi:uncharacterized protein LOC110846282 isoform X2 [Folsomia candida]|nr:uncharacterized protein LOC110846282 isoform X2 [Folsomia candida]